MFRTSHLNWTRTCDFFKVIVFGGIIVLITTFSLKRLAQKRARGDNGFVDPRFCFHLRISCHQKGMILFLGNRWKSSFSVTWMDWYGIQPKQEWNGNSNGMCSVKWMKGLGFEPRDREREKARGELIFQFYSKRVRAERQSNHNSKAMVQVQILQLELPKDSGQVDWSTKEGICKISTRKSTHVTRDELIQSLRWGTHEFTPPFPKDIITLSSS